MGEDGSWMRKSVAAAGDVQQNLSFQAASRIGLFKTLATSWHSNLQRRAAPDPPKFFNYDFFIVKLILA
jgi:hypothetical protein